MRSFIHCQKNRVWKAAVSLVLLTGLSTTPASATNVTSSITVTATVLTACLITSSALVFGNYDPTSTSPATSSTSVIATCTFSAPYTIALSDGSGTGAAATAGAAGRKMTLTTGSALLGYNLYQDAAFTTAWGSTTGLTMAGAGTGLPQSYTVYGRIPAQQAASSGAYLDTVTATLSF